MFRSIPRKEQDGSGEWGQGGREAEQACKLRVLGKAAAHGGPGAQTTPQTASAGSKGAGALIPPVPVSHWSGLQPGELVRSLRRSRAQVRREATAGQQA